MLGKPPMTCSLCLTVATSALLTAGFSDAALAQSSSTPTQELPHQAKPSPDQDPSGLLPKTKATSVSLFDHPITAGTKPRYFLGSWFADVDMRCLGCPGSGMVAALSESSNPNAPRVLQGTWRHRTTLGVVSTGFVGVRNYALPPSVGMPGGDFDPGSYRAPRASSFAPVSQWYLTAGIEKTLATRPDGASIGVRADVLIPVKTNSMSADDPRIKALKSRTARIGVVLRR
jgi:hypothetical protein